MLIMEMMDIMVGRIMEVFTTLAMQQEVVLVTRSFDRL